MNKIKPISSKEKDINNLHFCLLKITDEIARICKENNIKYFLIGGSLLGAIRHQGFIPWDDDLDIGMLREDYNSFLEKCQSSLGGEYICETMNNDCFGHSFAKVKLLGTHFPEQDTPNDYCDGIFIDVFPIDEMPLSTFKQRCQKYKLKYLYGILKYKSKYKTRSIFKRIIKFCLFFFPSLQSRKKLVRKILRTQTKYNGKGFKYISLGSPYKYGRDVYPKESIDGSLKLAIFENKRYFIPLFSDQILAHLYGDYMALPPVEQRVFKHSSGSIDFGPYLNLDDGIVK